MELGGNAKAELGKRFVFLIQRVIGRLFPCVAHGGEVLTILPL